METLVVLLCVSIFVLVQGKPKPQEIRLSTDEEECISQTGVLREVVLHDKTKYTLPYHLKIDPKFSDYIDCYAAKLELVGKLVYTKDVAVVIPGYKTKKLLPKIYCTEDELSGKVPVIRQCAYLPTKVIK